MLQGAVGLIYERGSRLGGALRRRLVGRRPLSATTSVEAGGGEVPALLAQHGVHQMPAERLIGADALQLLLAGPRAKHDAVVDGGALLALWPQAWCLGLAPHLLDLADDYLGQPCLYLGATLKREEVAAPMIGTRQWHLDIEDRRMLRILIYLCDVRTACGPFEYIAPARSRMAQAQMRYSSGYVGDEAMEQVIPRADWIEVPGTAGDAVMFDGTRVFHRAQSPRDAERLSLTLAYSTRQPLELRLSARLPAAARERLAATLDPRAAACLAPARLF